MEKLGINPDFWKGKRVLVTGHTGFKGGWLCFWLLSLGADVHGYALGPSTTPSFFAVTNLSEIINSSTIADIRDLAAVHSALRDIQPEIVFHLAAQPLVRYSYKEPVETYAINVMGTVNLLEVVRQTHSVRSVVVITSDKCYENQEPSRGYREDDSLGGYDPYSSSKACAELIAAAYRNSFLGQSGVGLATARAGNVIGGGDWAADRLIPDFLRTVDTGQALKIRSPNAVRPWQHVLEPLSGYLLLTERLGEATLQFSEAWNFGPRDTDIQPVSWLVEQMAAAMSSKGYIIDNASSFHETDNLKLDSTKANAKLGWYPRWALNTAIEKTLLWHQAWRNGEDMKKITLEQIDQYSAYCSLSHV